MAIITQEAIQGDVSLCGKREQLYTETSHGGLRLPGRWARVGAVSEALDLNAAMVWQSSTNAGSVKITGNLL